jgi:hypothetical protein
MRPGVIARRREATVTEKVSSSSRRNRIIAIVAGAITVTAIVVAFAGEYFDLPWKWLRPGVELLLLAELVGLVVLERHQLFEPVHETVGNLQDNMGRVLDSLGSITEKLNSSGQVTTYIGPRDVYAVRARLLHEALARNDEGPHIFRDAILSGRGGLLADRREVGDVFEEMTKVISEFHLLPESPPDARARHWSTRVLFACATSEMFDRFMKFAQAVVIEPGSLNVECKVIVRSKPEALLSPAQITDRDVVLVYDDEQSSYRWGLVLQGRQYVALFSRWFDDRWAATPDRYQIYGRGLLNQNAVEQFRKELESAEAVSDQRTA